MDDFKSWQFTATENGWTSDATALEWLKKVFIPQTTPRDLSEARLLILDGHGSRSCTRYIDGISCSGESCGSVVYEILDRVVIDDDV